MLGFRLNTQVLMGDGTYKNIQDIQKDEYVMSYDEETKTYKPQIVVDTITNRCDGFCEYIFSDGTDVVGCTDMLFLTTSGEYKVLEEGDEVVAYTESGVATLTSKLWVNGSEDLYDLDVEDIDNFVVGNIVVHNALTSNIIRFGLKAAATPGVTLYVWYAASPSGTKSLATAYTTGTGTTTTDAYISTSARYYNGRTLSTSITSGTYYFYLSTSNSTYTRPTNTTTKYVSSTSYTDAGYVTGGSSVTQIGDFEFAASATHTPTTANAKVLAGTATLTFSAWTTYTSICIRAASAPSTTTYVWAALGNNTAKQYLGQLTTSNTTYWYNFGTSSSYSNFTIYLSSTISTYTKSTLGFNSVSHTISNSPITQINSGGDSYTILNYSSSAYCSGVVTITTGTLVTPSAPTLNSGLVYNGSSQALCTAGSTSSTYGTYYYGTSSTSCTLTSVPTATTAGTYNVYWKWLPNSGYAGEITATKLGSVTITAAYKYTLASTNGHWQNYSGDTVTETALFASGTTVTVSSNVLKFGSSSANWYSFVANSATDKYTYTFSSITDAPSSVTAAGTITGKADATINKYSVTFSAGDYVQNAFTSTNASATSGNVSGTTYDYDSTVYYFVTKNANTDQYTYTCSGTNVKDNVYRLGSITVGTSNALGTLSSTTRTTNTYAVTFTAGTYCTNAFTSTSSTATSGNASGTKYNYGATVYYFIVKNANDAHYTYTSTGANVKDNVYRLGSITVGTSNPLGTIGDVTRTENYYSLTLASGNGYWTNAYSGNTVTSTSSYVWGTTPTLSAQTVYFSDSLADTYTFHPTATTVQYNYTFKEITGVPTSVTGASTITGTATRSDRTYTVNWIGADGSTALETDSNVAYNAVLTYNGSTPTKDSTAQYSYTFSAWKLGSTSGSTVTSGTTKNAGSTTSTTINIYSTFTSSINNYTVTFKLANSPTSVAGTGATWSYNTMTLAYGSTWELVDPSSSTYATEVVFNGATASGNYFTLGTAQYYTSSYSVSPSSGTVTGNCTITGTTIYTRQTASIKVEINSNISSISLTYYNTSGTQTTTSFTSSGSVTAQVGTSYSWTATPATGYTASQVSGSGTVPTSGVTISPTASLKSFTITFSGPTYGSWDVSSATAYYGDKIATSGTTVYCSQGQTSTTRWSHTVTKAADDTQYTYTTPTISGGSISSVTAAATITASDSRTSNSYTVSMTSSNGAVTVSSDGSTYGSTATITYGNTVYYKVNPNTYYYYSSNTYYHGNPYSSSITLNSSNFTISSGSATKALSACTAITYTFKVTSSNSDYCYYGDTAPSTGMTAAVTGTYANRANYTVFYKINPAAHYYCNTTSYYNGNPYSSSIGGSAFTFTDSTATASWSLNCTAITYTVSGGTATNGSVSWTKGVYDANSTWTITANDYYTRPTTYTGTKAINTTNFTVTDSNQTAVYSGSLGTCTGLTETIQNKTVTGGQVYWSASSITTSGGSTTLSAAYGSTVYWRIAANTGYDLPTTYYGSMVLNSTNFTIGSTTAASTATYKGSAIGNCTLKKFAVTISSGTGCSANKASGTYEYGTVITWTASDGYSFNGSSTKDTTTATITSAGTYSATPSYVQVTLSMTNCTYTSGNTNGQIVAKGTNLSTTFTTVNTSWSYGEGTSRTATETVTASSVQVPTTLSSSPAYTYGAVTYTRCSNSTYATGYHKAGSFTVTADTNYRFSATSATTTGTWSTGCNLSFSPTYYNITVAAGTGCTADVASGYVTLGTKITWTADSTHSFGGSAVSDTTTATVAAGTASYSKTPSYVKCTISSTRCTCDKTSGTIYAIGTTITWTASSGYAFDSSGTSTATDTVAGSKSSYSCTASYMNITISSSYCSANKSSGYNLIGSTITWTANANYSFAGSSCQDTTTATIAVGTTTYSKTPGYVKCTITTGSYNASVDKTSGNIYAVGTVITWTATSNYSYGGSSTGDTGTATVALGTISYSKNPGYVKCTISGTRCSANKTSGTIIAVGTTITWTASSGYAFNAAGTSTSTATVALGTTSYSRSADYENITVYSGTGCSANVSSGYVSIGTTITWTATSSYSFNGSAVSDTTTATVAAGTTSYSKTPGYVKCTISGTRCSADKTSGAILAVGTTITWTASSGYAFSTSGTSTATASVAVGTTSYSKSADYENVTISSGTGCSANKSSGYLAIGTVITWTASDGYSFGGSSCKDTTTATVTAGTTSYSKTPGYVKVTLSATNCAYSSGNTNGQIVAKGTNLSTTFAANDYYSYSEGTSRTSSETKTASSVQVPTTLSSSPAYVYGTVSYTRCSNSTYATGYHAAGTFTVTASSGYRFTTSSATTTGTWSKNCSLSFSPTYYNITVSSGTGCSANVSSGYVALGTTITWTATSSYSFGGSTVSDTGTATVTAGTASYSKTPGYVKCTISGTRCTANKTSGTIIAVGTIITWTASSGYGFDTSGTSTATATVALGTTSYSRSADYENITVSSGTGCSANVSSGYRLIGAIITWTATSYYSFGGTTAGDTSTATIAVGTTAYSRTPGYVKCTITGNNCTANKTSDSIYAVGTAISWTASSGYSFDTSGSTSTSTSVVLGTTSYSKTAKRYIVVAPTAESKTWDGSTLSASNTASITSGSLASGDTITYTCTGTTSSSNAGTYSGAKTISAVVINDSSSATVTSNYYINNTSSANLVINKAAVTPVAPALKTGLTYTSVGQALCNAGTSSYGTYYYGLSSDTCTSTSVPTGTNATTYTVYWKWTADGNHTGSTSAASAGTVTIATRTITVIIVAKSKAYGDSDPTLQYTYSSKTQDSGTTDVSTSYGTDTMCVTLSRTTGESAGSYNITGTATFSANGTYTNYALSVSGGSSAFTINKVALGSIASVSNTNYTGSAQTPTPSVTATVGGSSKTLTKDTDYTLSYQNNTNAGTATVTATGKGNFSGTLSTTWTISKIASSITLSSTGVTKTTGSTVDVSSYVTAHTSTGTLSYAITTNGTTTASTISGSTVTLGAMSSSDDNSQTVIVTITNPGDGNYNSSTKTFTITVTKNTYTLSFNNSTSSVTYGSTLSVAATCSPSATISYSTTGSYTSISSSTLTGTKYSGSSTDTITASVARTTTYAPKSITRTVSVTKASGSVSTAPTVTQVTVTYDAATHNPSFTAGASSTGTMKYAVSTSTSTAPSTWYTSASSITAKAVGTYYLWYYSAGDSNHNDTTKTCISGTKAIVINYRYISSAIAPSYPYDGSSHNPNGASTWYTISGATSQTNAGSYSATAALNDTTNTRWDDATTANKTITWTITKVASTLPTSWSGDAKYYHDASGNVQTAALTYTGYSGGTIYFASSTTSSSSGFGDWTTTAPTRSGTVGSTYVKCYIKADDNHTDSAESSVVSLTINANTDAAMVVTVSSTTTYDGSRHVLATASDIHGIASYYLGYSITSSTDSSTVSWGNVNTSTISALDAHTYYIWYKFTCDEHHSNSKDPTYVGSMTINKATGTCTVTPTGNLSYQVPDSATIATPKQSVALTYNGSAQSPDWSSSTTYVKVEATATGDKASATNAGSYTMTASLTGASYFTTKTDSTKSATGTGTLSVSSSNTNVATVSISSGTISVVYKGTQGTTTITVTSAATSNYNAATATFTATCTFGTYIWSDGTTAAKSVTWTIAQASNTITLDPTGNISYTSANSSSVTVPTATALKYNAKSQSPTWANVTYSSVSGGTTSAIKAGTYSQTATLKGTAYFKSSSSTKTATANENPTMTWSSSNTSVASVSPASTASGSACTITYQGAGTATITVASAATTNYKAASTTFTVTCANGKYIWSDGTTADKTVYWTIKPCGYVYTGSAWTAITEAYIWDGTAWVRVYPVLY